MVDMIERTETGTTAPERPSTARWFLVGLLALAALLAYGSNAYLASSAIDATAKTFDRTRMPGTITTTMHPGPWRVWLEGPGTIDTVEVTDGSGRSIDVSAGDGDTNYRHDGFEAQSVATFTIPRGGLSPDVRVTVTGAGDVPETTFAVGPADEFDYVRLADYGTTLTIALTLLVAAAIAVLPILRSRRRT